MSAPERVFVQMDYPDQANIAFMEQCKRVGGRVEYIRADIHAARIAELEAELEAYREMQAESNAQGGPNVIRLRMQARRGRVRAEKEAAENARLREAVIEAMDMDCTAAAWTILRDALATLDKEEG